MNCQEKGTETHVRGENSQEIDKVVVEIDVTTQEIDRIIDKETNKIMIAIMKAAIRIDRIDQDKMTKVNGKGEEVIIIKVPDMILTEVDRPVT